MMHIETMRNVLCSIYELIENISDANKQNVAWNGLSSDAADSFDESVESLYDYEFDNFLKENHTWYAMDDALNAKMNAFNDKLHEYSRYVWSKDEERNIPAVILADPK